MHNRILTLLLFILSVSMSGCSTVQTNNPYKKTTDNSILKQTFYQVNIPSFDGTRLRATIYQPALGANQTAPLIIHEHGFSTGRMSDPVFSIYGSLMPTGEAAKHAWKNGYWVISVDQRGFGGSGGKVHLQDPEFEIRDTMSVIDWASTHLPKLAFDDAAHKDPKVGMVGESYGGANQLLTSIKDPRIDAIVPITTWYNLSESLAPDGQLKSFWTKVLVAVGDIFTFFDMDIVTSNPDIKAGKLSPESQHLLYRRSMAYFCDRGQYPQADTLLLQGFRDSIFPINEGWKNKECIEKGNKDVRLISIQGGHLLPIQKWTGMPFYNIEKTFHCEDQAFNTIDTINNWFDAKLKGQTEKIARLPHLCITQDYKSGIVTKNLQRGGESFFISATTVRPGLSGTAEWLLKPVDWVADKITSRKSDNSVAQEKEQGGFLRPAFLPLKTIHENGILVGIPTADLTFTSKNKNSVVFVGVAVKRANSSQPELISEQAIPINQLGTRHIELAGVSTRIEQGDVVGLVLYGASGQYLLNRTLMPSTMVVTGKLELPLFKKEDNAYVAYTPNSFLPTGQAVAQTELIAAPHTVATRDTGLSIQE